MAEAKKCPTCEKVTTMRSDDKYCDDCGSTLEETSSIVERCAKCGERTFGWLQNYCPKCGNMLKTRGEVVLSHVITGCLDGLDTLSEKGFSFVAGLLDRVATLVDRDALAKFIKKLEDMSEL